MAISIDKVIILKGLCQCGSANDKIIDDKIDRDQQPCIFQIVAFFHKVILYSTL